MTLSWLADVLRDAGLVVVEHAGWRTHDRPGDWSPVFGVVHATAAPRSQADSVQVDVVRNGRSDLPGPIANAVVDRQGRWHVVSGGRCNSTLEGTAGPYKGKGNTYALSVEGCNDNVSEPWPAVQYQAYVRGWAAWCARLGWSASHLVGHREHTPGRKSDPTFSMTKFRADVAHAIEGDDMPTAQEIADAVVDRLVTKDVFPNGYGDVATNPTIAFGTFVRNAARMTEAAMKDAGEAVDQAAGVRVAVDQLAAQLATVGTPAIDYDQLAAAIVRQVLTATAE